MRDLLPEWIPLRIFRAHNQKQIVMTHTIILKERRAQLLVKEMDNGTAIVTEPDESGWVRVSVQLNKEWDVLCLFHAGMSAQKQFEKDWEAGLAF